MTLDLKSTTIDGHLYEMTMLPATPGWQLFLRLFKMFGPSFGGFMDMAIKAKGIKDLDLSSQAAISVMGTLATGLSEEDFAYVVNSLKGVTQVSATPGSSKTAPMVEMFELHFQGKTGTMFQWIWWGLVTQYANFSDVLRAILSATASEQPGEAPKTHLQSPNPLTGFSGDQSSANTHQ